MAKARDKQARRRAINRRRSRQEKKPDFPAMDASGVRLNRFIAMSGFCARRKADEYIAAGEVRINGKVVTDFSYRVSETDAITVQGRPLKPQQFVYILLNKPADTITTTADERGRRTVLDFVDIEEVQEGHVFPVGRLDRHTVGVLLLTNDGELANRLMHPRYQIDKYYHVETAEPVKPHELDLLRNGIKLEDGDARVDDIAYLAPPDQHHVGIKLHEGRNRQIRRMLEALGHTVVYLERVNYAGLTTEGVRRGKWRRLKPHEVRRLRSSVKLNK